MNKSVASGIVYFFLMSLLVLGIVAGLAYFRARWDELTATREYNNVLSQIEWDTTIESASENFPPTNTSAPATENIYVAKPLDGESETAPEPNVVNISLLEELNSAVRYDGDLELPISGATGYASVNINMMSSANSSSDVLKVLAAGTAFLILKEEGDWWEVSAEGVSGWVQHIFCMINLPDVIPSMIYDDTNAYSSLFVSSGVYIPNVTNEALYQMGDTEHNGKVYNERLQRYEYIMPVLYSMSKKICKAQQYALNSNRSLILYEGYRPYSAQMKVVNELTALSKINPEVKKGITTSPWNMSWFIATGLSNHQMGYAIDVSLVQVNVIGEAVTGKYRYRQVQDYTAYTMPTPIHELSMASATFTSTVTIHSTEAWKNATLSKAMAACKPAQYLQKYCTDAQLTPLASEWWHFNDLETYSKISKSSNGGFTVTECYSIVPSDS